MHVCKCMLRWSCGPVLVVWSAGDEAHYCIVLRRPLCLCGWSTLWNMCECSFSFYKLLLEKCSVCLCASVSGAVQRKYISKKVHVCVTVQDNRPGEIKRGKYKVDSMCGQLQVIPLYSVLSPTTVHNVRGKHIPWPKGQINVTVLH